MKFQDKSYLKQIKNKAAVGNSRLVGDYFKTLHYFLNLNKVFDRKAWRLFYQNKLLSATWVN